MKKESESFNGSHCPPVTVKERGEHREESFLSTPPFLLKLTSFTGNKIKVLHGGTKTRRSAELCGNFGIVIKITIMWPAINQVRFFYYFLFFFFLKYTTSRNKTAVKPNKIRVRKSLEVSVHSIIFVSFICASVHTSPSVLSTMKCPEMPKYRWPHKQNRVCEEKIK